MGKVKVKMEIEFWYDPETNEYTPISNKVLDDKPISRASKVVNDTTEPTLTLLDNKYVLSPSAVELIGATPDDRIEIRYSNIGGHAIPLIRNNNTFGTKGGNKLTKAFTVSCRGEANKTLANYGDTFKVVKSETEGVFLLNGNKTPDLGVSSDLNITLDDKTDFADLEKLDLSTDLDDPKSEEITLDYTL